MGTVAHAQEALSVISGRRHKQDVGTRFANLTRQLWKLDVVADENADGAVVGLKQMKLVARDGIKSYCQMWSFFNMYL